MDALWHYKESERLLGAYPSGDLDPDTAATVRGQNIAAAAVHAKLAEAAIAAERRMEYTNAELDAREDAWREALHGS